MSPEQLLREAQSLHQSGRLPEAERHYLQLVELFPANADLWHLLGVVAYQQGDAPKAIPRYRKALELRGDFPQARNNLALALKGAGDLEAAAETFAAVLAACPDYAEAAYNLALLHEARGDADAAERSYRQALAAKPEWFEALGNLGNLLRGRGRLAEAQSFLEGALRLRPEDADALANMALLCIDQGRHAEARTLAVRATAIAPESPAAWEAAGSAARLMGDADGAAPLLRRAAELSPDDAAQWFELALALEACADDEGARSALAKARTLAPDWERVRWFEALMTPRILASEADADRALQRFDVGLERLETELRLDTQAQRESALEAASATLPFNLHYLPGENAHRQARFADLVAKVARAALPEFAPPLPRHERRRERLRVGFVSSSLKRHVVTRYFGAFITGLDRDEFEKWVWFTGHDGDDWTREIAAAVDRFEEGAASIAELAERIRAAELDVLVYPDLGLDPRQQVLAALRLSPVQAACYGHPVTSGLDSVDYFLGGEALELPGSEAHYREKLVRLPGLGAKPRAPEEPGDGAWARALRPNNRALVMCLQNLAKLPPDFDALLAEILARSGARLVLFNRGAGQSAAFRRRFERALAEHGVDASQALHIEPLHEYREFLGGILEADLILDPPGFSGGGTSLDALGIGAPVLCLEGSIARARQSSAMLRLIGIPELIASDGPDYVKRALDLLADRTRLAALRLRIREHAHRLFDDEAPLAGFAAFLRDVAGASVPNSPR